MIMTNNKIYSSSLRHRRYLHCIIMLLAFWSGTCMTSLTAQEDTLKTEEPPAEPDGFKSKMSVTANQFPDGSIELNALLRVKYDESYQGVPDAKIGFFSVSPEGEELALGNMTTGANGIAILVDKGAEQKTDADGNFTFIARFEGKDAIKPSETDLLIHPAKLDMQTEKADSIYLIRLTATSASPDGPQPIVAAPVTIYVKRMFSSLKVGEGETDEAGFVEIEFPNDLAGDENANLEITAMIEETELYGNLTAREVKPWGYSVNAEVKELPRALWSPHPPTWMVVTFFILMGTVWTHYFIIMYKLFRIKSEKPAAQP